MKVRERLVRLAVKGSQAAGTFTAVTPQEGFVLDAGGIVTGPG